MDRSVLFLILIGLMLGFVSGQAEVTIEEGDVFHVETSNFTLDFHENAVLTGVSEVVEHSEGLRFDSDEFNLTSSSANITRVNVWNYTQGPVSDGDIVLKFSVENLSSGSAANFSAGGLPALAAGSTYTLYNSSGLMKSRKSSNIDVRDIGSTENFTLYANLTSQKHKVSLSIIDSEGSPLDADVQIKRENGRSNVFRGGVGNDGVLEKELKARIYDLNAEKFGGKVGLKGVNLSGDRSIQMRMGEVPDSAGFEYSKVDSLAVEPQGSYESGSVTLSYSDSVANTSKLVLRKCDDWVFDSSSCGSTWQDISYSLNGSGKTVTADVDSFSAFALLDSNQESSSETDSDEETNDGSSGSTGGSSGGGSGGGVRRTADFSFVSKNASVRDAEGGREDTVEIRNDGNAEGSFSLEVLGLSDTVQLGRNSFELGPGDSAQVEISVAENSLPSGGETLELRALSQGEEVGSIPVYFVKPSNTESIEASTSLDRSTFDIDETPAYSTTLYNLGDSAGTVELSIKIMNQDNEQVYSNTVETNLEDVKIVRGQIQKSLRAGTYRIRTTAVKGEDRSASIAVFNVEDLPDRQVPERILGYRTYKVLAVLGLLSLIGVLLFVRDTVKWERKREKVEEVKNRIEEIREEIEGLEERKEEKKQQLENHEISEQEFESERREIERKENELVDEIEELKERLLRIK